jgi:hypothetical protein
LVSVLFDTPDILLSPAHVQIRILSTKMFLTLNFYVQVEGLCPRRDKKKEKLSKSKLNSKTKFKKKGGTESEVRYRPRR